MPHDGQVRQDRPRDADLIRHNNTRAQYCKNLDKSPEEKKGGEEESGSLFASV